MCRVYMYVFILIVFFYCYVRFEENGDLGVFYFVCKVDLVFDESDVILKVKVFNKRLMCLFYCRIIENKRVNGKIRGLLGIFFVMIIVIIVV